MMNFIHKPVAVVGRVDSVEGDLMILKNNK